jgi:hypothetical protein
MLRFEGPDGRPLPTVTIRCDQDDAAYLLQLLRAHIADLEKLAQPGTRGQIAVHFGATTIEA